MDGALGSAAIATAGKDDAAVVDMAAAWCDDRARLDVGTATPAVSACARCTRRAMPSGDAARLLDGGSTVDWGMAAGRAKGGERGL